MEFKSVLENYHKSDVWGHHVVVPEKIADHFLGQRYKRVICTINDQFTFHCALMPKGNGIYFINVNSDIRKKMRLRIGTEIHVVLKKDDSKYGMPMPEEMGELLKMDDEASKLFHALTPGKMRSLLHLIASPKTTDTRLKKAIVITEFLKSTDGRLDFKELNQAFKDYNQF